MQAHNSRGIKRRVQGLIKRKRTAEALTALREATARNPGDASLLCTLGELLATQGAAGQALAVLERALALDPSLSEVHRRRGVLLAERGDPGLAEAAFKQALTLRPEDGVARVALGDLYLHDGRPGDAFSCYKAALQYDPRSADAHFGAAAVLARTQRLAEAIEHLERAVALEPRTAAKWEALGACAERSLRYDLAIDAYTRAAALRPRDPGAAGNLARALEHLGAHREALQRLEPFLGRQPVSAELAIAFARLAPHCGRVEEAIGALRQALGEQPDRHVALELQIHLGQLYDKAGDYDHAFGAFSAGNRLHRAGFDRDGLESGTGRLIRTFGPSARGGLPRSGITSEKPVFVVGMLRSGTTLVEQILASHPLVYGAGELNDINSLVTSLEEALPGRTYPEGLPAADPATLERAARDYLQRLETRAGTGAARIIDKMPGNFRHLGLVSLLFPGARVIHCVRDPVDTCLSILSLNFDGHHPYAYDQEDLGFYYRQYRRLMEHWKQFLRIPVLDVHYERLVSAPEAESRRMVAFLGLDWDDACLRFHESGRKAHTASYDQVRRPIYTSSVQRWRHYEKHLHPLLAALGQYAPAAPKGGDSPPNATDSA